MSTFGDLFKVTTYGESHCKAVGCIVEGVPPRMKLTEEDIQPYLLRRRPGQSAITTSRNEEDKVVILSGTERGYALGTPISLMIQNKDHIPGDYKQGTFVPRPSHADYSYLLKYGVMASSGGGRASARETAARVAAGAIADKWLKERYNTDIVAYVSKVGSLELSETQQASLEDFLVPAPNCTDNTAADVAQKTPLTREVVDSTVVRCPVPSLAEDMYKLIQETSAKGDSIGGEVSCVIRNCPIGIGEPVFDRLSAVLAHAMMSIPATKGFSIGKGFEVVNMYGSVHNDAFMPLQEICTCNIDTNTTSTSSTSTHTTSTSNTSTHTTSTTCDICARRYLNCDDYPYPFLSPRTNHSSGIQGGISMGSVISFTVAFKPVSTIKVDQPTCTITGEDTVLQNKGRHDPCVVPRAVAIVEAMAALVLADLAMKQEQRKACSSMYPYVGNGH